MKKHNVAWKDIRIIKSATYRWKEGTTEYIVSLCRIQKEQSLTVLFRGTWLGDDSGKSGCEQ